MTYQSRQRNHYKDSSRFGWPNGWGTLRDLARWAPEGARERRREASLVPWGERRALPTRVGPCCRGAHLRGIDWVASYPLVPIRPVLKRGLGQLLDGLWHVSRTPLTSRWRRATARERLGAFRWQAAACRFPQALYVALHVVHVA